MDDSKIIIPWMARVSVHVQLEVLVIEKETPTGFVDRHVIVLLLREHVIVVPLGKCRLHFDNLSLKFWASHRIGVSPVRLFF